MLELSILLFIAFVVLIIGSYTDIKTHEVPDWINFGLLFAALGIRTLYSTINKNPSFIIEGLFGFAVLFSVAIFLFYSGQWGGGDSKLLMALGAVFGLEYTAPNTGYDLIIYAVLIIGFIVMVIGMIFSDYNFLGLSELKEKLQKIFNFVLVGVAGIFFGLSLLVMDLNSTLISFLVNLLIVGGLYGLAWIMVVIFANMKTFRLAFIEHYKKLGKIRILFFSLCLIILGVSFLFAQQIQIGIVFMTISILVLFFLWIAIKAAESFAMIKKVPVSRLTEGDWITEEIIIDDKKICSPDDLGLTLEQIDTLKDYARKGKIKKVTIKEGIPFVPSFLIAFIITHLFGFFLIDLIPLMILVN